MLRAKRYPEFNYESILLDDGIVVRRTIDDTKPFKKLEHPDLYDIKITNKCFGNCPYCYMNSVQNEEHPIDLLVKVTRYFKKLSFHDRPYQVAIGGGEPTLHPHFTSLLGILRAMYIIPNYTTNGMHLTTEVLEATKQHCEGVAISCHPHLDWKSAVYKLRDYTKFLCLHLIISDEDSINYAKDIINKFYNIIDTFVLLPYYPQGRAKEKKIEWKYLVNTIPNLGKLAFGAGFTPQLQNEKHHYDVNAYGELFGGFIDFTEEEPILYESSFNLTKRCYTKQ